MVEHKWLWLTQMALAAVVTLLMALGSGAASKMEQHDTRIAEAEARGAAIEARLLGQERTLNRIEDKLDRLWEAR